MNRKQPLQVVIKDGVLSITIGVETLCNALQLAPCLERHNDETQRFERPVVTDEDVFVKEILRWLTWENEDGTDPIGRMLDAVALFAIEQGAAGVRMPTDD